MFLKQRGGQFDWDSGRLRCSTMVSYVFTLSVLLLLNATLTAVCESAHPVVKVEYNGAAVLPCTDTCSGVIRWTPFSKSSDFLAECDQTSCRSVKEGYQMIYNQYLQGDFSLIITEADYSKRGLYVCDCDGKDLCEVQLQIEALKTTLQMKVGDSLLVKLDVSDKVEVIYSSTEEGGPSNIQICTVEKRSLKPTDKYTHRVSLSSVLELRGMTESDSGVYTVRDILNDEIIRIYTVTVHGDSGDPKAHEKKQNSDYQLPGWGVALLVVLVVLLVGSAVGNLVQWRNRDAAQMPPRDVL
ncbi:hypothetical protein AMEX_G25165 [Astyanax mexicanus]|uniref:Ig-like domain-containing protein n=1 Tax=Astyanax mexicanus TaxID=7994 RepID=A0A8T2KSH8_ASTMX|nr:hypothetical protein AMEX_G25165 [Astyanax mexicanus]